MTSLSRSGRGAVPFETIWAETPHDLRRDRHAPMPAGQNRIRRTMPRFPIVLTLTLVCVTLVGWLELTVTLLMVLAVVDLAWVFLAARARRLLKSPRAMKIANRLSAGMIGGAAVAIATR